MRRHSQRSVDEDSNATKCLVDLISSRVFPFQACSIMDSVAFRDPAIEWDSARLLVQRTAYLSSSSTSRNRTL